MTERAAELVRIAQVRERTARLALAVAVALSLTVVGRMVSDPSRARLAMAGAGLAAVVGIGARAPRALLYGLVVWLAALGFVRRLASQVSIAPQSDPLLLVEAAAVSILVLTAVGRGAFVGLTRLAKAVLVLSALVVLGALNPLGSSLSANFGSLFLLLIPMLAFWVGRTTDDNALRRVLLVVAVVSVFAAIYGLMQTFSGFPSWDAQWIGSSGFSALNVGGTIRAFGPFASSAEYAGYLGIGLAVWLAFGLRVLRSPLTLAAVVLLGIAIFYESSRGAVFGTVFTVALMAAAALRLPVAVSAAFGAAALLAVPVVVKSVAPQTTGTGKTAALVSHQIQGLSSPLNSQQSTFGAHLSLVEQGVRSAFHEPVGRGIGLITVAGSKYGSQSFSTEADPSNAAVALGIPGLAAYLAVVVGGFVKAYSVAARRRDALSIAALAVIVVPLMQWLNGGEYAVAFLVWLVLGWIDRAGSAGEQT